MGEKIKKEWPALRACADVQIEECGQLKIKGGQCVAFPETIHRIVKLKYAELRTCENLVKEGISNKDVALKNGVYEIYSQDKKPQPEPQPEPEPSSSEPESSDEDPGADDGEYEKESLPTESVLMQLSKAELLAKGEHLELDVSEAMTKKEIVAAILESQEDGK